MTRLALTNDPLDGLRVQAQKFRRDLERDAAFAPPRISVAKARDEDTEGVLAFLSTLSFLALHRLPGHFPDPVEDDLARGRLDPESVRLELRDLVAEVGAGRELNPPLPLVSELLAGLPDVVERCHEVRRFVSYVQELNSVLAHRWPDHTPLCGGVEAPRIGGGGAW